MSARHSREAYFIANRGSMRGSVDRAATPSERASAFRFSEMVLRGTPPTGDAVIRALAERMTAKLPDQDGSIPAGYTYLGQFLDHDMTMDATRLGFGDRTTATALTQGRSPALDLDSLYGLGPAVPESAPLYEANGVRFRLGRSQGLGNGVPPFLAVAAQDREGFDLPRFGAEASSPDRARMAVVADQRNDENLAIAQIHLAFLRFHNAVVDSLAATVPSALLFDTARREVTFHYQWLIRHDYLPRIVDPAIVDDVFANGRRVFEVNESGLPSMPIEFSVAAFRLGHSMIRDAYDWNPFFHGRPGAIDAGSLLNLFRFSGTSGNLSPGTDVDNPLAGSFERLPSNWIADWTRLFDFVGDGGQPALAPHGGAKLNMARRIDTHLTDPLSNLPLGSFGGRGALPTDPTERNLAFRNLIRGRMVHLATAQEVAVHFERLGAAVPILTAGDILGPGDGGIDLNDLPSSVQDELVTATPLWFYILREAERLGGRLGAVGGRIVAETFHRAIEGSRLSILREPSWRPRGGHAGGFGMPDLLLRAYDAAQGELRPLSPEAPRPS